MPNDVRRRLVLLAVLIAAAGGLIFFYESAPKGTFNPFCAYRFSYRLNVTIEVDGKPYSSQVAGLVLRARDWYKGLGSCSEIVGSIVPFRLDDKRLVVMWADICPLAVEAFGGRYDFSHTGSSIPYHPVDNFSPAMREHRKLDVTALCVSVHRGLRQQAPIPDGFVIDNADNPARWRGFRFDSNNASAAEHVRIISAVAEAANVRPDDGLEEIAPEILKSEFKGSWSDSPEAIFANRRPYIGGRIVHSVMEE